MAAGESVGGMASPESGPCTHMRSRMEEFAVEKIGKWRNVNHWLMSGFLPAGKSSLGAPGGGVSGWRWSSRRKIFPTTEVV